jgi:enolase
MNALYLHNRVSELHDASAYHGMQLKNLAEKIEHELYKYYSGVNSLYQRKYRALVSHLTDTHNQVKLHTYIFLNVNLAAACSAVSINYI